jgi:signal transduction histidine kinase
LACGATIVGLLPTLWLQPLRDRSPVLLLTAAVIVTTAYGGIGPGILASALAVCAVIFFFLPELITTLPPRWDDLLLLTLFFILVVLINVLYWRQDPAENDFRGVQKKLEQRAHGLENVNKELRQALAEQKRLEEDRTRLLQRHQKGHAEATEALQQKHESLAVLNRLLADSGIALAVLDRDCHYIQTSDFFLDITNLLGESIIGQSARQATPKLWPALEPLVNRVKSGQTSIAQEMISEWALGGTSGRNWLISCVSVRNPSGQYLGIGVLMIDMTERKQNQEIFSHQAKGLAQSHAKLERLAYVAFYELKEPLLIVATSTKVLAQRYQGKLDGSADELIVKTIDGISRMERLIGELVSYLQFDPQTKTIGPIDAKITLEWALNNLEAEIAESQAVITYDSLPTVAGNATQMIHLFQSLIGHAIRFASMTSPRIHFSASFRKRIEKTASEWVFAMQDCVDGTPSADRIFLLYEGILSSTQHRDTGYGPGVCKQIIEGYGGRLWVEAQPGSGSTLYFSLPAAV